MGLARSLADLPGGRLADAALPANKDPPERGLIEHILDSWVHDCNEKKDGSVRHRLVALQQPDIPS